MHLPTEKLLRRCHLTPNTFLLIYLRASAGKRAVDYAVKTSRETLALLGGDPDKFEPPDSSSDDGDDDEYSSEEEKSRDLGRFDEREHHGAAGSEEDEAAQHQDVGEDMFASVGAHAAERFDHNLKECEELFHTDNKHASVGLRWLV